MSLIPIGVLEMLYECPAPNCRRDLHGEPLAQPITISALGGAFTFTSRTKMVPRTAPEQLPTAISCPHCGFLIAFVDWVQAVNTVSNLRDAAPPDDWLAMIGVLVAFGSMESPPAEKLARLEAKRASALAGPLPDSGSTEQA